MADLFDILPESARPKLRAGPMPAWTAPMLATLSDRVFSDRNWLYEPKLDGERCLAFRDGRSLRLLSRNRKELNRTYPELVQALRNQPTRQFIVDGEVVAFEHGISSFARLQGRIGLTDPNAARKTGIEVYYYLFDILYLEGRDVTDLELRHRKRLLQEAIRFADPLRFSAHREREGAAYYEEACRRHWEGLVAKRADSPYVHERSHDWLKLKCSRRQEFVIGGYTDPQRSRVALGALLIGYYDGEALRYAGKVGTGMDTKMLRELLRRLSPKERAMPAFTGPTPPGGGHVHWVEPELVAEVAFTEWTADGRLRHPRFMGLRRDKEPRQVIREEPARAESPRSRR